MPCQKPKPINRRDALRRIGGGFAMMSFASMIGESLAQAEALDAAKPGAAAAIAATAKPWMLRDPNFKPKAKHVIYLQFDNVHYTRDNPNVPSDLEQMPNLLNFIVGDGTLISHEHARPIPPPARSCMPLSCGPPCVMVTSSPALS